MPERKSKGTIAYTLRDALYVNLTNSCTLSCSFCPKTQNRGLSIGGYDLRLDRFPTVDEVWAAVLDVGLGNGREVVFTGFGESTTRFSVVIELIRRLKGVGVARVRLDTDGLASLREGRDVVPELAGAGLDAVSVSLNAADSETYANLCPSQYGEIAWFAAGEFLRSAKVKLPETVASFVGVAGLSKAECSRLAEELGVGFRWRQYREP